MTSLNQKRKWFIRSTMVLGLLALVFFCGSLLRHTIPFEIQSLLSSSNPVRIQYEKDLKSFNDEASAWIVVKRDHPFTAQEIQTLSEKIGRALDMNYGFDDISGPHNAKYFEIEDGVFRLVPFIRNGEWTERAQEMLKTEMWRNNLLREDLRAFLINFRYTQDLSRKEEKPVTDRLTGFLKRIERENPGIHTGILGVKVASSHFLQEMQFQQRVITPLLLLGIGIFLFFCYRSFQILAWNFFIMFVCYAANLCLIILIEGGLGPYSSFALMFAFIVATTDLIHFFSRFQQLTGTVEERLQKALKISYIPCLLTSLTTAAGFLALIINQNLPIRYFGLYCAFSCMLEWYLIFYVLPPLLRAFNFNPRPYYFNTSQLSHKIQTFVSRYSKSLIAASLALVVLGISSSFDLHIDDNFYTKFTDKHDLTRAINLFSDGFDFVGSIDVVIKPKKEASNPFTPSVFDTARAIERDLESHPQVSRIVSLRQLNDEMDRQSSLKPAKALSEGQKNAILHFLSDYGVVRGGLNEETGEMRIVVFLKSMSSEDLMAVLDHVESLKTKYQNSFAIRASGFSAVRSYINSRVIKDFFESFLLSFVLIFLCYLWLYRDAKWAFLALIPNAIPLLAVSGSMSLFKVPVDTNLVILICVAFGIVGDNTVHLSYVLQQEQLKGMSYDRALKGALKLIGVAIFATSGIFLFCLPVFLLGELKLFSNVAIFLSIAFIAAFLADTFGFPAMQRQWGWSFSDAGKTAEKTARETKPSFKEPGSTNLDGLI
ncbi:MAG: efflux RND transporter permease subunit [Pseudobdellovibrionaceae bacterium]